MEIENEYYKTKLYDPINQVKRLYQFTHNQALSLLTSKAMNSFNDVLAVTVMLMVSDNSLTGWISSQKFFKNFDNF